MTKEENFDNDDDDEYEEQEQVLLFFVTQWQCQNNRSSNIGAGATTSTTDTVNTTLDLRGPGWDKVAQLTEELLSPTGIAVSRMPRSSTTREL